MKRSRKLSLFAAGLILGLLAPGLAVPAWPQSQAKRPGKAAYSQASTLPAVTAGHWQRSSLPERHSFLMGFISMLDLEKEWQGNQPLPMEDSLIGSWSRGLEGLTIGQIGRGIDDYIAANPDQPDKPVLEVMWFKFVQPKVTETLSPEARAKGRQFREEARNK